MVLNPQGSIASLYRTYLREIRQLPTLYLRQFFQLKASDDLRAAIRARTTAVRDQKLERVQKDLRKIQAAKPGNAKTFRRILDLAYGRRGKLKRELMDPLLHDPTAPLPPRIIPAVERSRPPVYSPELKALLTSSASRRTKPLSPKSLVSPPSLPARADPTSEDARLLGPLSKRREVNIRWRYFTTEWQKVRPPLQIVVADAGVSAADTARAGIRGVGFQGTGVFEDVERIAGPARAAPPLTRREVQAGKMLGEVQQRHPSKWLRRRYQQLLWRLPVLTYESPADEKNRKRGKYVVSLSPSAAGPSFHPSHTRMPEISSAEDEAWLRLSDCVSNSKKI